MKYYKLTTDPAIHFTEKLKSNQYEIEHIDGLTHNAFQIYSINILSKQALKFQLILFYNNKDVSGDNYIDDVYIDLTENPIQENGLYYLTTNLMFNNLLYLDTDMSKTLHVAIVNRSKKNKKEGDGGMVKISFIYQPKNIPLLHIHA